MIRHLPHGSFLLTIDSRIVNMNFVLYYWPNGLGLELYMSNKHIVPVSRYHAWEFNRLKNDFPHILPLDSEDDIPVTE
jgi:hypothetical protein